MTKPVLIVKRECPFCFKFLLWVNEVGQRDFFTIEAFTHTSEEAQKWRGEIKAAGMMPAFPAVKMPDGTFMTDSDRLIEYFGEHLGVETKADWILDYYLDGLFPTFIAMFKKLDSLGVDPHM